eukprot:SAG22_NODE_23584_length_142_cov_133.116279_1_plen_29_part_10
MADGFTNSGIKNRDGALNSTTSSAEVAVF